MRTRFIELSARSAVLSLGHENEERGEKALFALMGEFRRACRFLPRPAPTLHLCKIQLDPRESLSYEARSHEKENPAAVFGLSSGRLTGEPSIWIAIDGPGQVRPHLPSAMHTLWHEISHCFTDAASESEERSERWAEHPPSDAELRAVAAGAVAPTDPGTLAPAWPPPVPPGPNRLSPPKTPAQRAREPLRLLSLEARCAASGMTPEALEVADIRERALPLEIRQMPGTVALPAVGGGASLRVGAFEIWKRGQRVYAPPPGSVRPPPPRRPRFMREVEELAAAAFRRELGE
jgi:hypothetical protein